ncbi:MAG: hypothetical protein GX303_04390 [Clostridiales bacterium]|nr:hypothetical protein [Clostridiales bacterium]
MKGKEENCKNNCKNSKTNTKKPARKRSKGEGEAAKLERIWSREEALAALKQLYLVSMEGALERVVDKRSGETAVQFNASAASTATKAIEAANKMMGYQKPEAAELPEGGGIEVEFLIEQYLCE